MYIYICIYIYDVYMMYIQIDKYQKKETSTLKDHRPDNTSALSKCRAAKPGQDLGRQSTARATSGFPHQIQGFIIGRISLDWFKGKFTGKPHI